MSLVMESHGGLWTRTTSILAAFVTAWHFDCFWLLHSTFHECDRVWGTTALFHLEFMFSSTIFSSSSYARKLGYILCL